MIPRSYGGKEYDRARSGNGIGVDSRRQEIATKSS